MNEDDKIIGGNTLNELAAPAKELASSAKDYLDLRINELKLATVEALSCGLGRFLNGILLISLLIITSMLLSFAAILVFGELIGNYAIAASIVAGIFLIFTIILFALRKKMFVNSFVRMFTPIFFDDEKDK